MKILATSGGFVPGRRSRLAPGPLLRHALELAGSPDRPRLCYVGTALGDQAWMSAEVHKAFAGSGVEVSVLDLLPMPSVEDVEAHLLAQHVVWVGGGSVAGLLALWRLHGVDRAVRAALAAGVVLGVVSAGSLCWHVGGTTDSFGPRLRPVTDGLALLPYGNGVHYDTEEERRPLLHRLVADGTLPLSYATDDGVGLVYEGTELVEAVADRQGVGAYRVERGPDGRAVETRIEPRRL